MALLLNTNRLRTALRRPGPSRLRKLAPPAKLVIPWIAAAPSLPRRAAVSVDAPTAAACPTNAAAGKQQPTLYLLHRHLPRSTDTNEGIVISQEQLHQLHDDLKAMEKVAKRAAWFSTVEAGDGEHVLLLTDCEKMGRKYGLQAMPVGAGCFTLDLPGRSVSLPLEEVSAALLAQKGMESSSDNDEASGSDDDNDGCPQRDMGNPQVGAVAKDYNNKKMEKAAKKQRKEEEKAAKALAKLQEKSKDEDNSEDESEDEEEDKKVTKAKKKDKEEGEKKKKNKEEKEEKEVISSKVEEDSEEEDSSSGSDDSDEEMATMDATGMEKINKMEDGSDSESDNENGSESSEEEATIDTMEVRADAAPLAIGVEECQSMDEEGSGSESEESGSESSEEEMEVKAIDVVKAVETGEITPLEA
ncbi:hypothetical protein Vretimale_14827 [Volvox reticuliferus]|uniref:Uncharacterized protein n=1 Tax=Volvox reticuliferus TaxID=1737510 RepID=A0A8J4GPL9_9CHLO|nr:hypothetical protein Vretifemale_19294 [Volvox reticuliferus]GIM11305.1 hypothetical protein Vretimale_14827 [Volvox reticuliferus]